MSRLTRGLCRLSVATSLSLLLIGAPQGAAARAPDDDEDDAPAPAVGLQQPLYLVNDALFNRMVYGNLRPEALRDRLEAFLNVKITDAARRCNLSEDQKEKLRLAGRGDIRRVFDRIEDRKDVIGKQVDQEEYIRLMNQLRPLQGLSGTALFGNGLFGNGSYFAKALKGLLDEGQAARYGGAERELTQQRYLARIEQVVVSLDGSLGLSADQRRRLTTLLVKETRPPRQFSSYDGSVVLYQMARLPEARVRPIFDDLQWQTLCVRLNQARAMEQVLRTGNYLPDDAPPAVNVDGVLRGAAVAPTPAPEIPNLPRRER
jgi:hypothetical protein